LAIAARHLWKKKGKTRINKNTVEDASLTRRIGLGQTAIGQTGNRSKGNKTQTWLILFVFALCSCFANLRSPLFHCRFSLNPVRAVVLHRFPVDTATDTDTSDDKLENSFQGIP